ncbi:MAG: glucosamine-6-phosphate deaminase [Treponema sp.]|nr:glucosamine-6-phosphate deaminase [Treponema sp.]
MRLVIERDYDSSAMWTADYIAGKIKAFSPTAHKPFVLGLPTGSTPLGVYRRLIELHKRGIISFEHVITFNMDEYVGLAPTHPQSYHYFMHTNFFDHIDIKKENINLLDGMTKDIPAECAAYEQKITAVGGINVFFGGAGVDGHIAFNEPGSSFASRTRKVILTEDTRTVNARFFDTIHEVPFSALSVGIGTVMDAQEIVIMLTGHNKARALAHAVEGAVSQQWPITTLQLHADATIVCDDASTDELKVGTVNYFKGIELKAPDQFVALVRNT